MSCDNERFGKMYVGIWKTITKQAVLRETCLRRALKFNLSRDGLKKAIRCTYIYRVTITV